MSRNKMTEREQDLLAFVRQFLYVNRYPPTLKQIASGMRLRSVSRVYQLLVSMRRKGVVQWEAQRSRTLSVVDCK